METHTETLAQRIPPIHGVRPRFRPLRGYTLLRLLPHDYVTTGGLHMPDVAMLAAAGEKDFPRKAIVVAIGEWRRTKQGFAILPDFHPGQRVLISEYAGVKCTRNIGEEYRLCLVDDVLAVLEEELTAPPAKT